MKYELLKYDSSDDPQKIIETAIYNILIAIGEDPEREGLKETPNRVARAYSEIFSSTQKSTDEIAEKNNKKFYVINNDLVTELHITCYSMCEHHLLPMKLDINIGYIPQGYVLGLSKLARIADEICKKPQLQERIGINIADAIRAAVGSEDVIVVISGEHSCMTMRGIKKPGTVTRTACMRGKFDTDHALRQEFYNLIK